MNTKIEKPLTTKPSLVITASLIEEAARLQGIETPSAIIRKNNTRTLSRTRFGLIWVMRHLGFTLTRIRDHLGFKDHTSVMYGFEMAMQLRVEDPEFRELTDTLLVFAQSIEPQVKAA